MGKHSKNVTNAPTFRHKERAQLDWGTQTQRVGADSLKALAGCGVCLHVATTPVICNQGHLFCHECVLESLLAQRAAIKAAAARHDEALHADKKRRQADAAAAARAETDAFVAANSSVVAAAATAVSSSSTSSHSSTAANPDAMHRELKRKMRDEDEKRGLSCFWAHQNVPQAPDEPPPPPPPTCTMCPDGGHELKLKQLTHVVFKLADAAAEADADRFECPSCLKRLKNGVDVVVLTPCGHALCAPCNATQDHRCFVCEKPFRDADVVALANPGTGFAVSGAKLEAKKQGVHFIG